MEINTFQLDPSFKISEKQIYNLIKNVVREIQLSIKLCNIIFVSDKELAKMHETYLNDPSPTDILTFNLGEDSIEGELYISYEKAMEHSNQFGVTFQDEIKRLIIHGLLHLAGYDDLSESDFKEMKEVEDTLVRNLIW